jgi:hypothetical protein
LHIPQNPFDLLEMAVTWIVHKETDLLNGMGEIRSGEGEVLESSSQAAVFGRIRYAVTGSAGNLALVSSGVAMGLQFNMLARSNSSSAYCC